MDETDTHIGQIAGSGIWVWGMGGSYNTIERVASIMKHFSHTMIILLLLSPKVHRLSSSEPTQVTDSSVLPTMGGFYRGKVGGRY